MKKLDTFEKDLLDAFEKGELKSTSPSKAKLAKFKAAASATLSKIGESIFGYQPLT